MGEGAAIAINALRPEQETFALWLILPATEREPKMQKELAAQLGVTEETLSRWKSVPQFADAVLALKWSMVRSSDVHRIVDAQVRKALKGNTSAADWVFRVLGLRAGSDRLGDDEGAPGGALAQASASIVNIHVDGQQVEDENARRAAARALVGRFRVLPGSEGHAQNGHTADGSNGQ
jgi:hypothetical protein